MIVELLTVNRDYSSTCASIMIIHVCVNDVHIGGN